MLTPSTLTIPLSGEFHGRPLGSVSDQYIQEFLCVVPLFGSLRSAVLAEVERRHIRLRQGYPPPAGKSDKWKELTHRYQIEITRDPADKLGLGKLSFEAFQAWLRGDLPVVLVGPAPAPAEPETDPDPTPYSLFEDPPAPEPTTPVETISTPVETPAPFPETFPPGQCPNCANPEHDGHCRRKQRPRLSKESPFCRAIIEQGFDTLWHQPFVQGNEDKQDRLKRARRRLLDLCGEDPD